MDTVEAIKVDTAVVDMEARVDMAEDTEAATRVDMVVDTEVDTRVDTVVDTEADTREAMAVDMEAIKVDMAVDTAVARAIMDEQTSKWNMQKSSEDKIYFTSFLFSV